MWENTTMLKDTTCGSYNKPTFQAPISKCGYGGKIWEIAFNLTSPRTLYVCQKMWKIHTCLEESKVTRNKKDLLYYGAKSKYLLALPIPVWPGSSSQP